MSKANNTLIRPKRWQDRLRIRLKGYLHNRPEGVDHIERCPNCRAKAYGHGSEKTASVGTGTYLFCMACGYNTRFGPQGPPPGTPIVEPDADEESK